MSDTASNAKATPAVACCFLLNQLLAREGWARERLQRFAGQSAEFRPPFLPPLGVLVAAGGRIEPGGDEPAAIVTLDGVTGESELADELRFLQKNLRWDFEEELSQFMGDVAAERVGGALRAFVRWQADAAQRVSEALADYATAESGVLVGREEFQRFAREVQSLGTAIGELERRLA